MEDAHLDPVPEVDPTAVINSDDAAKCASWKPLLEVPIESFSKSGLFVEMIEYEDFTTNPSWEDCCRVLLTALCDTRLFGLNADAIADIYVKVAAVDSQYEVLQEKSLSASFWDDNVGFDDLEEDQKKFLLGCKTASVAIEEAYTRGYLNKHYCVTALKVFANNNCRVSAVWQTVKNIYM